MIIAMSSFYRPQRSKRVVVELPYAIATNAEFDVRTTDVAYDEMSITIKQDDKKIMTITRDGEVVKHDA
jgi:hypothetical protein